VEGEIWYIGADRFGSMAMQFLGQDLPSNDRLSVDLVTKGPGSMRDQVNIDEIC